MDGERSIVIAWGPLRGIRVLAFTHVAAGPYATLQLAYLGAEVIKVESATRIDPWRLRDRNRDPEGSRTFADHNKNTRSVTLDLKKPEGVALAKKLAAISDIVIDNFSAGVLERLGLGDDVLRDAKADLIVIHLSGLGATGPSSHYVTFGPSIMAFSGMTHLWGHPGRRDPVGSQTSYPDYLVGAYAAYIALALLHERERTGEGRCLDVSQLEVAATALGPAVVAALNEGGEPMPQGNGSDDRVPHGCYPCRGGNDAWCVISVRSDAEWSGLRRAMGDPDWASDARLESVEGRRAARATIDRAIAEWTTQSTPREVFERCQAEGVPAGFVATGEDLRSDPHLEARGFLVDMSHPRLGDLRLPGAPLRLGDVRPPVWRLGPLTGEDNDLVFGQLLGVEEDERRRLEAAEVIR